VAPLSGTVSRGTSAVVKFVFLFVLIGCSHSSFDNIPISTTPSTPADRCRWKCEQTLSRETDRVLAHRGLIDAAPFQTLFEEEDRCRAACGDD
jgi:hypothetical protein